MTTMPPRVEREVPANVAIEASCLGACMLDPDTIDDVRLHVRPDSFFRDTHQLIAAALFDQHDRGAAVDALSLADELERRGQLARVGGLEALADLLNGVPYAADATYHAQIVAQLATRRAVIEAAEQTLRDAYGRDMDADQLQGEAESRFFAIRDRHAGPGGPVKLDLPADDVMRTIEARRGGRMTGLPTGLGELDDFTDGLHPGQLVIIGARPSIGKTAIALSIIRHAAAAGHRCLMFSMEMGVHEIAERLIIMGARVDGHKVRTGQPMTTREDMALGEAYHAVRMDDRVWVDDGAAQTPESIMAIARRHKRLHGLDLIAVDYLQLMDAPAGMGRGASRQEQIATISRRMKALARTLAVPVLCLCQLNREAEGRADRRPLMSDLRESGALEQDANVVGLLHRPEFYDATERPGQADLILAKNRNGPTGTVRLAYVKQHLTFADWVDTTPFGHTNGAPF